MRPDNRTILLKDAPRKKTPRLGVYRIGGWEAICERHGWYGSPGLDYQEAREELKAHREAKHGN